MIATIMEIDFASLLIFTLLSVLTLLGITIISYNIWGFATMGKCKSKRRLDGKTVIVTGPSMGMGKEIARDLAKRGAKLIMAGLDDAHMKTARADIEETTGNKNIVVKYVDLSSLESVRHFCQDIVNTEDRLDVLVNNAGVAAVPKKIITKENLEFQMCVNYFGPFLLTNLLTDLLKKTGGSRVVNVGSVVYKLAQIDLDNLNSEKHFNTYKIYAHSKLALTLFTKEFARRVNPKDVTCNILHPGGVSTNLTQNIDFLPLQLFLRFGLYTCCKSPAQGAQIPIYLAVSEEVENISGKYFEECKEVPINKEGSDVTMAKNLWEISEQLTGLSAKQNQYVYNSVTSTFK